MNAKMISALVVLMMFTSVCTVPLSSSDIDAEDVVTRGNSYGISAEISDENLPFIIGGEEANAMYSAIKTEVLRMLAEDKPFIKDLVHDIDIAFGISICDVSENDREFIYDLDLYVDGHANIELVQDFTDASGKVVAHIDIPQELLEIEDPDYRASQIKDYVTANKGKASKVNEEFKETFGIDIVCGGSVRMVTDASGDITSMQGTLAMDMVTRTDSATVNTVDTTDGPIHYLMWERTDDRQNIYVQITDVEGSPADVEIITFHNGETMLLDDIHSPFVEIVNVPVSIPNESIVEAITYFESLYKESGNIDVDKVAPTLDFMLTLISLFIPGLDDISIVDIIATNPIVGTVLGNVLDFLFGADALCISPEIAERIDDRANDCVDRVAESMSDETFEVKFVGTNDVVIDKVEVGFGKIPEKTQIILDAERKDGKKFIGWYGLDSEGFDFTSGGNLGRTFGHRTVYALFADVCTSEGAVYAPNTGKGPVDRYLKVEGGDFVFKGRDFLSPADVYAHIDIGSENGMSVLYTIRSNPTPLEAAMVGNLDLGYTIVEDDRGVTFRFDFGDNVSTDTMQMSMFLNGAFEPGTPLNIFVGEGSNRTLADTALVGEDGSIRISDVPNSSITLSIDEDFPDLCAKKGSDSGNTMLYVGIGAAVAVALVSVFLLRRKF